MKYSILAIFPLLFTSCDLVDSLGARTLFVFFAVLFVLLIIFFVYTIRKRRQADKTIANFSNELQSMLGRIKGSDKQINALNHTIKRINKDERYKKDEHWRDLLLVEVYQKMATIYFKEQEQDKLLTICGDIIRLSPGDMMAYYNRGTLYGNMGMYEEAEKDLTEALNIDASYANIYNNRGMVYEKLENYEKAITDYTYALDLDETAITYYNRANVYFKMKEKEKAIADYEMALNLDPSDSMGLKNNIEYALKQMDI